MTDPIELLRTRFGFPEFRPGQQPVIDALLAGRSAAAVFPTGGGKSLCYQLPALCLDGLTLVVSPLIALMKDQIDALANRGIRACRIDSTLSADEYRGTMDAIRAGEVRLLYVAPERFNNERFRAMLRTLRIAMLAVDEAHCISEWGHAFRPDYLKLARFATGFGCERVLALTATATPKVLDDICQEFEVTGEDAIRTGFYRANLRLRLMPVEHDARDALLLERLAGRAASSATGSGPAIVYVTLQKTAERVAEQLSRAGHSARPYHAGLGAEPRAEVQEWFMKTPDSIVVATIAFGMGIDKADIRAVYHYNLPKSLENYAQEIGRAGRDGLPARCEMLACPTDLNALENFIYGDTPERDAVTALIAEILNEDEQFDVSIYDLAYRFDIRDLVVRTLLTYLELDGWLEGGTPLYSVYKFKPKRPSGEILAELEGERRDLTRRLLACAKPGRTWFSLDLGAAMLKLQQPRESLVQALDHLGEQGWLELQASGVRHRYRRLRSPDDLEAIAGELHDRCIVREKRECERLNQVVELIESASCQTAMLCEHFGESIDPCGHCSVCESSGSSPAKLPDRGTVDIHPDRWRELEALRAVESEVLGSPRAAARFACGVTSPQLVRAKLSRHPLFGALQRVPFQIVLAKFAQAG